MSKDVGRTIIGLFKELQKLNRFITIDSPIEISLAAVHVLIEIDADPGLTIGKLAEILMMKRTSTAAVLQGLSKRRLVSNRVSKQDKRHHALLVTKTGKRFLANDDAAVDAHLAWIMQPLTEAESEMMLALFRRIADGFGVPDCPVRPDEHFLRKELRRATRALRLIHADFFGSKMGSPEWQFLSVLIEHRSFDSTSSVALQLQIPLSSATTIAARLKKRGLVEGERNSRDGRASRLSVAPAAEKLFAEVEGRMAQLAYQAVSSVSPETLNAQLDAFSRAVKNRGQ